MLLFRVTINVTKTYNGDKNLLLSCHLAEGERSVILLENRQILDHLLYIFGFVVETHICLTIPLRHLITNL